MMALGVLLASGLALVLAIVRPTSEHGISTRAADAATPAVTVSVGCKSAPETTRVKNNRNRSITINAIGSIYRPYDYEPFRVSRTLRGGGSITFESGSGANSNTLTKSYIYNNDVGSKEGARVSTSVGNFVDRCG
jgi:hypothetical protein